MIQHQPLKHCFTWLLFLSAFLFVGCSARERAKSVPPTVQAPVAVQAVVQGIATYVDGEVSVANGGEWKALSAGDGISMSESVRTGASSRCEIQFGRTGIVKVGPNSSIQLKTVSLAAARNAVDIGLAVGSISCKVSKLTSKDRFEVITSVASCGVRGTEFVVIQASGKPMRVAVREGRVAVIPPSFDAAKLDTKAGSANEELADAAIASVMDAAPAVVADQELVVAPTDIAQADTIMASVQTQMESALADAGKASPSSAAAPASAPPPAFPEAVGASIKSFEAAVQVAAPKPRALSDDSRALLQDAARLELKPEASVPSGQSAVSASVPVSKQSQVNPAPASASAPASAVEDAIVATVKVSAVPLISGIQAANGDLVVVDAQGNLYAVSADRKPAWTAKTGNAENENSRPVADSGSIVFAGDKDLCVLDAGSGKIAYTIPLDASDSGLFGRRPVIADGKLYLGTSSGIKVLALTDGADAGSIPLPESIDATPFVTGSMLYLVSSDGSFYIIDRGKASIAASVKTSAYQPIATSPTIIDSSAFFVDRKGLVVNVDLDARSVVWQKRLDAAKSLNVLQDPVLYRDGIYVYAKSTIYALSKKTGERLFEPIANASSPPVIEAGCLWFGTQDGKIVAADANDGRVKWSKSISCKASGVPSEAGKTLAFPTDEGSVVFVDAAAALR
jgi:outer membrane protein assembly factor BamB